MITIPRNSAHMKVTELFFYLGRNYSWNDTFYQRHQKCVFRILKSLKILISRAKDSIKYEQQDNSLAAAGSFWIKMSCNFWLRAFCSLQEG